MSGLDKFEKFYQNSVEKLKEILGKDEVEKLAKYLHVYDETAASVKPVAKHVTIYWVGRTAAEAVLRTEGEDDIIVTRFRKDDGVVAVPTLIFRKQKAVFLRGFMELARSLYTQYEQDLKKTVFEKYSGLYGNDYNFLSCGISPGIEERRRAGTGEMRCMKCPVDVLMGAVTGGGVEYNLASRVMGDPAFATEERYRPRTGNAVDEVTYTTGMGGVKTGETGALYTERVVEPGTIFVGKTVLFMPSPVELVYTLYLLTRVSRYGARKTIMGVMEIHPVALVGDMFETGTAYAATEQLLDTDTLDKAKEKLYKYVESEAKLSNTAVLVDLRDKEQNIKKINVDKKELYLELWKNAARYVMGIKAYVSRKR